MKRYELFQLCPPTLRTEDYAAMSFTPEEINSSVYSSIEDISAWFSAVLMATHTDREDCVIRLLHTCVRTTHDDTSRTSDVTAILLAAMLGDDDVMNNLIDHGADVTESLLRFVTYSDSTRQKLEQIVARCIESDVRKEISLHKTNESEIDLSRSLNTSSLVDTVKILIRHGAHIDKRDKLGSSVLMKACEHGWGDVVQLLLESGVQVDSQDIFGHTALSQSVRAGKLHICRLLIDLGHADVTVSTVRGSSALMFLPCDRADIASELIQHGCDVNATNSYRQTALTTLLHTRSQVSLDLVQLLLRHGEGLVNMADADDNTPLMLAAAAQSDVIVSHLLQVGAEVNATNKDGKTALLLAVEFATSTNLLPVCRCLLKSGSRVGEAIFLAILKRQTEVVSEMIQTGSPPTLFVFRKSCFSNQTFLLSDIFASFHLSPLALAIITNNSKLVQLFLECNFLASFDLSMPRVLYHADRLRGLQYLQNVYNKPWRLLTLCVVCVSDSVGDREDRRKTLTTVGLPKPLQNLLMFQRRT